MNITQNKIQEGQPLTNVRQHIILGKTETVWNIDCSNQCPIMMHEPDILNHYIFDAQHSESLFQKCPALPQQVSSQICQNLLQLFLILPNSKLY
jgi:hypothetical protein